MILIVDDTPENLFSLKTLLQINGFEVDTAASGEEALFKILKTTYALIILDVQMPGMDGYEVAEAITGYSRSSQTPIIFLSAVNIDKRFVTKGYASGGVDYVTKPFDPDLLLLKVKTFYRLYRQTKELNDAHANLEKEVEIRKETEKLLYENNLYLEQKVLERTAQLQRTNEELKKSNLELQQYAFLASHDLQEPLRKILTFGNIMLDGDMVKEEGKSYMSRLTKSSERMRNLIEDLLQFSGLSETPQFIFSSLNEIVAETLTDLELVITDTNAEITLNPLPAAEVIPGELRQLFFNIIGNAIKFSKKAVRPQISITGETTDQKSFSAPAAEEGQFVRIKVSDNGIGFDEMYLDKIFSIFQRLNGREEYAGTGIGLAIVKKIVEKHSGLITAQSTVGVGTTFILVLPLRQHSEKHGSFTPPLIQANGEQI